MESLQIQSLQEAILHHTFFSDIGHTQFQSIESCIPFEIFWRYKRLAEFAKWKTREELDISKSSTEIVKQWLQGDIIQLMNVNFSYPSFYDDIKILVKEYFIGKQWDEFEKLLTIQEVYKTIDEKKASYISQSYKIKSLYDEMITELDRRRDRKQKWEILGYSFWFPLLDKYTDWLQRWTLMRLNAYSNIWKSKFSYQIVNEFLRQWAKVIYFSLEVWANQLIYNLMANFYKIPIQELYKMNFWDIDFEDLFEKNIEIVTDKYQLSEILGYTAMRKPDIIVIDFVQNIRTDWNGSEYERMTEVAIKLQQLAIKENIAVFDISQVSNEWAKVESDIIPSKWSGALVASADVWLLMKRDKIEEDRIQIKIAKNKFWWRKTMEYKIDYETWIFTEIGEVIPNKWL